MRIDDLLEKVDVKPSPPAGVWRVARQDDPLRTSRLDESRSEGLATRAGNRWDSPMFGVLYFTSELDGCFGEILSRFRPKPSLAELVRKDWSTAMAPGQLPRDWRDRRIAIQAAVPPSCLFLDVESVRTRIFLTTGPALGLSALGLQEIDVADIRGKDRRVTQLISQWAYNLIMEDGGVERNLFAGISYLSRVHSGWQCWAIYDRVDLDQKRAIPTAADMPSLTSVCTIFGLRVH